MHAERTISHLPKTVRLGFSSVLLVAVAGCAGAANPESFPGETPRVIISTTVTYKPAATVTIEITPLPTLVPTIKPTLEPTPTATQISEATSRIPEIITPTPEMIEGLNALNNYRAEYGLPALPLSKTLTKIAVWKADDMNKNNYFSHINSLGEDIAAMDIRLGYTGWKFVGENIYTGNTLALGKSGQHVVDAFSKSSSHRDVMLGTWAAVGIGRSYNPTTDMWYWTQEYGTRLDASIYTPPIPTTQPTPTDTPEPTPEPTPIITPVPTLSSEPTVIYGPCPPSVFDARRRLIE